VRVRASAVAAAGTSVHPHDHIAHPDIKFNNNESGGKNILRQQQLENKVITRIKSTGMVVLQKREHHARDFYGRSHAGRN